MKNSERKKGCFLCEEVAQHEDRKNYILYRGAHSFVLQNIYPYNNGHLLVAPYAHVPSIEDLGAEALTDLMKLAQASVSILKQVMNPEGFNVGINIGKAAGAGLPEHLHIQIVPRWTGDTSYMSVFDDTRVIPESLDMTYEKLRPLFEKLQ